MTAHLILIHGMGESEEGAFRTTFKDGLTKALNLYGIKHRYDKDKHILSTGGKKFQLHEFAYNEYFKARQEASKKAGETLKAKLGAIADKKATETQLLKALVDMNEWHGSDDFFQTHWLDVLLYRYTVDGEAIRVALAKKITEVMNLPGVSSSDCHIVAHSLGTSVAHDTLHALYTDGVKSKGGKKHALDLTSTKLGSVSFFANVSKVLEGGDGVIDSVVKPGDHGCTNLFMQFNHKFDPIPRVSEFDPKPGEWVSDSVFDNLYVYKQATDITAVNVHAIDHYLLDPVNHLALFGRVMGISDAFRVKVDIGNNKKATKLSIGKKKFKEDSLLGKADEVREALQGMVKPNIGSLKALSVATANLVRFIKEKGEAF